RVESRLSGLLLLCFLSGRVLREAMRTIPLDLVDVRLACGRFNPVTLSFERIGRQREPMPSLVRIKAPPVHRAAGEPQPSQRVQQGRLIGPRFPRVAE